MKWNSLKTNLFWTAAILVVAGLILWPLIRQGFFQSDDGEWMVIRLSAFFQTLRDGQFPTRFLGRLNYEYGYPVSNFLYPGFLYLGSAVHLLGVSFVNAVKVMFAGSVIGSAFFIFKALKKEFNSGPSFLGTIGFILAPYVAFDLYVRGSVGEVLALLPASMGFYSIATGTYWLFPLAVSFLIISHNTAAVIFLFFFLLLVLLNKTWGFFLPMVIGIGMASFFWIPALYDKKYVVFDAIAIADPSRYFLTGTQLLLLGFVGFASAFIVLANKKRATGTTYFMAGMIFFGAFMATGLSSFLWNSKALATLIQFPYRFLLLTLIPGSWLIARSVSGMKKEKFTGFIIFASTLWVFSLLGTLRNISYVSRPLGFYTTNEATTTVRDEYMPIWVQNKPTTHADRKIVFYNGGGQLRSINVTTQKMEIEVVSKGESIVQFNTIYYPGWGVLVDDQPVRIDYKNPEGVMRVVVPNGKHTIVAAFHETISRFSADAISGISLLGYIVYIILLRKRNQV